MLLIDKRNDSVEFILTVSERIGTTFNSEMEIVSPYSNTSLLIALDENVSPHASRYDQYVFNVDVFDSLQAGKHFYKVYFDGKVVESGIAVVISDETEDRQYVRIESNYELDDDYVVYSPREEVSPVVE